MLILLSACYFTLPMPCQVVSHDRWFCDRVLAPPPLDEEGQGADDTVLARPSSLFVFEGGGKVSRCKLKV